MLAMAAKLTAAEFHPNPRAGRRVFAGLDFLADTLYRVLLHFAMPLVTPQTAPRMLSGWRCSTSYMGRRV